MNVVVRVRPGDDAIATTRKRKDAGTAIDCNPKGASRISLSAGRSGSHSFEFDWVLGPDATQFDTWARCCVPLLDAVLQVWPACLLIASVSHPTPGIQQHALCLRADRRRQGAHKRAD